MAKKFVGILDTQGLDRFAPLDGQQAFICELRAQSNPQRHACVFMAEFEDEYDPEKEIRECKDPWDMWSHIQCTASNISCKPVDRKTIINMRKLATALEKCTGRAY